VSTNYFILGKKFEEEMNSPLKRKEEKQPTKKRPNISRCFISKFFVRRTFKKDDMQQNQVLEFFKCWLVAKHITFGLLEAIILLDKLWLKHLLPKYYDYNTKISYKLWGIGFGGKFSKNLFLAFIWKKHVNRSPNEQIWGYMFCCETLCIAKT